MLRRIAVWPLLVGALLATERAYAAEQAKSVYLLGVTASMAGLTPPPGTYGSSFTYLYGRRNRRRCPQSIIAHNRNGLAELCDASDERRSSR